MLEKFSVQAVQIIEDAKKIATNLNHKLVGSEHLLLSMYETADSICRFLLQEQNITYQDLVDCLSKIVVIHKKSADSVIFTDKFQEIVLNAEEVAQHMNSKYVFDEHIFYSMLEDNASVACEILRSLNLDFNELKQDIEDIFNFLDEDDEKENNPFPFLINLSKEKLNHPYISRSNYITRINYILNKKQKNNPLLIGNAGVGKTAIVEGLASQIKDKKIYQLDLGGVIAGTKYRGELEEKLLKAIEYVKEHLGILFIDEIHNVVGAGSNDGSLDIANILKPYLSRNDLSIIGATTIEEYYRFIDKDKALMRRFQTVFIDEPTIKETKAILMGIKETYEDYHQIKYDESDIDYIIEKSNLYLSQKAFPDKAIDVLDEVGARYIKSINIKTLIDKVIKDLSNINSLSVEKLQKISLNYQQLKPNYLRFIEKTMANNNLFVAYVNDDFLVEPLLKDLYKIFGFKKEMYLEINLDHYQEPTMINNLIGSSKGYVGYEQGGIIPEHIIKYPLCLILFKNMKHAHASIKAFLDKLIKNPSFVDNKGRKINLQNTMFIFDNINKNSKIGFLEEKHQSDKRIFLPTIKTKHPFYKQYLNLMKKYQLSIKNFNKLNEEEQERFFYQALALGPGSYIINQHQKCIKQT